MSNDEHFADQTSLDVCGFPVAWDLVAKVSTAPTKVAIVDTGVDLAHPDLPDMLFESFGLPFTDNAGHGTCVAGILGAIRNNKIGIAGAVKCQMTMYRVFGKDNKVSVPLYHEALEQIAASDAKVVNLSIAGLSFDAEEEKRINACVAAGKTVIAAVGNSPPFAADSRVFPAALSAVIAVGAATDDGDKEGYSLSSDNVFIAAPGTSIWTTTTGGSWAQLSGTSLAAPLVTAACAVIYQLWPNSTPGDVAAKLQQLVASPGAVWNRDTGFGLLDLHRLPQLVKSAEEKP